MKKTISTISLLIAMLLISCSQEQAVDISMLQVDKGLAYLKDTDRLFTGTAVSYYENGQLQYLQRQLRSGY